MMIIMYNGCFIILMFKLVRVKFCINIFEVVGMDEVFWSVKIIVILFMVVVIERILCIVYRVI